MSWGYSGSYVIPALGRWMQADDEFKTNLGYEVRDSNSKNRKKIKRTYILKIQRKQR